MKPILVAVALAAVLAGSLGAAKPANAAPFDVRHAVVREANDHFSLSLNFGGGGRAYCPPPVYYAPPPYYYAPPVGYYYAPPPPVYPAYGVRLSFGGGRHFRGGDDRRFRARDDFRGRRW